MNQFKGMDCDRFEAMLPAFVGSDLGVEEAAAVAAHVESCARCRESLAAFVAIEETLVLRRSEVPPVDGFLPDMRAARWALRARPRLLIRFFRAAMSVPGVAIVLVMWATFLVSQYNDRLTNDIVQTTSLERATALAQRGLDAMVAAAGGDAWTLTAVYGALAIGLIVSAGALTMRFVRD
jgi:anti-sigma factor RsiW